MKSGLLYLGLPRIGSNDRWRRTTGSGFFSLLRDATPLGRPAMLLPNGWIGKAGIDMRQRTRKLIGAITMIAFILLYGPLAMALAESRIVEAPQMVQVIAYIVLGLAWVLPLMPLIRWMQRPDPDEGSQGLR